MLSTYAYPTTSNRLTSITPGSGTARAFTYDAAGDIVTDTRTGALGLTYQYDVEGRLAKAYQTNAPANGATYAYDARGRLVSRTVTQTSAPTSTTTFYMYDLADHIIAETDSGGHTQKEYIWLGDMPVAVVDGVNTSSPTIYYVHVDHLMRPIRMTAQNLSWVWDVNYAPFGQVLYLYTNPEVMNARFPGQWFQLETGLAYNWHRHYDPTIGRYIQPDPKGLTVLLSDGPSVYSYARGNPLSFVDLMGFASSGGPILCLDTGNGGGGRGDACEQGFERCQKYAEQLYDKGYVDESNLLYLGCRNASRACYGTERNVQGNPFVESAESYFPPNKQENGGGFVSHAKGRLPFYVPPFTDPISPMPPKH